MPPITQHSPCLALWRTVLDHTHAETRKNSPKPGSLRSRTRHDHSLDELELKTCLARPVV